MLDIPYSRAMTPNALLHRQGIGQRDVRGGKIHLLKNRLPIGLQVESNIRIEPELGVTSPGII